MRCEIIFKLYGPENMIIILGKGLVWLVWLCVRVVREMRSKHFLSSTLGFTWQVSRFSLVGGLFGCTRRGTRAKGYVLVSLQCPLVAVLWGRLCEEAEKWRHTHEKKNYAQHIKINSSLSDCDTAADSQWRVRWSGNSCGRNISSSATFSSA